MTIRHVLVIASALFWSTSTFACFTPIFPGVNRSGVENAQVVVEPSASAMVTGGTSSINRGFQKWNNSSCQASQEAYWVRPFPTFNATGGTGTITVRREDQLSSGSSACASIFMPHNSDDADISLHSHIRREDGDIYQCNWDSAERTALVIAHELGHYLGLNESNCQGSIMGNWHATWNSTTGIATLMAAGHAIRDDECTKADEISISPTEESHQEQTCLSDPECDPYAPCWSDPGCTCPILLDLDLDSFQLASARSPVRFDIDNDGELELVTWTRGNSRDAFLCWDRNRNGKIDNGSELFGNSTQLADGSIAPFGYIALSELDSRSYGGNLDGFIDKRDKIFATLCVWTDLDHDGQTDPQELEDLPSAGIVSVGIDWTTRPESDATGNLFLYHGQAIIELDGGLTTIPTTDVYFVEVEPPSKPVNYHPTPRPKTDS